MHGSIHEAYGFKNAPNGIGSMLRGWDVPVEHYRNPDKLPVVDFRAFTQNCPLNCYHCYTDKQKKTLTLGEIKGVIDQLADMGAYAINYLGEGEPTADKDFFPVLDYTNSKGIIPVVFTEGTLYMRDKGFVRDVKSLGASVVPKCDSLFNEEYQNWIVGGGLEGYGKWRDYFNRRNESIRVLMDEGFNEIRPDGTTRMGFDMVLSTKNVNEAGRTLRCCRDNNLWIIFSHYLPSGRSAKKDFDKSLMLSLDEKRAVAEEVRKIDSSEYNHDHPAMNNFLTCGCVEFMQIYGDGRVSVCPGNSLPMGNVREKPLKEIRDRMFVFEKVRNDWDRTKFDGNCVYRDRL
jgi:MoaA/NifB/PqqE/SkfB family radical SAM enzyme